LSKTIPIWCAVLNAALFPDLPSSHTLHTPPNVVTPTENAQITARLPTFLASLASLALDLPSLRAKLTKPLRPLWITPGTALPPSPDKSPIFEDYRPVVCCTASSKSSGELGAFEGYVQGAADDTEHWAMGLTAPLFWANSELLLSTDEEDLPGVISGLLDEEKDNAREQAGVRVADRIYVCPLPLAPSEDETECQIVFLDVATPREDWVKGPRRMEVGLGNSRQAQKNLRSALPAISSFAERFLLCPENAGTAREPTPGAEDRTGGPESQTREARLVIACPTGKDLSLATALALHCRLFTPDDSLLARPVEDASLNKAAIRQRLGRMMIAFPEANPARATLQSVNSFLMG
ncbi:hypothetical protein IMZ48_26710, partial [Candidatus Bathyarchaeota archaeon]|nr:hypothetical protein [Candidatus Bathyarchaeota archaeon]